MAKDLHIETALKIRVYVTFFADFLWSVIVPALGLKTIPDVLEKQYTQASHMHATYHGLKYAMCITTTRSRQKAPQCAY